MALSVVGMSIAFGGWLSPVRCARVAMAHRERHRSERIGWLRAAVLGANDGIVSTASLAIGVAAAAATRHEVLVAGIAAERGDDDAHDSSALVVMSPISASHRSSCPCDLSSGTWPSWMSILWFDHR
jgi:VIT family protein